MARSSDRLQVAIPLFPLFTALDAIGPYEVLQRIPTIDVTFIGHQRGVVRPANGFLGIEIDASFDEVPNPDVVVFPGGSVRALLTDEKVLDWVRTAHEGTRFTTSVCTGALVLAAAGLLDGLEATTHWERYDDLEQLGAIPTPQQRVVEHLDQRIITSAGVSSGIDMALRLTELLFDRTAAETAQLEMEYDPQPPFDSGALHKASDAVKARHVEYQRIRAQRPSSV